MCFIGEVSEAIDLSLYIGLKNPILLVFHLVTGVGVAPIVASRLFYSNGSRLSGGLDTLRRRSYKVAHYYYKKPVFYQLLFPAILELSKVPLEVEFELEILELELIIEEFLIKGFLIEEVLVIEGFLIEEVLVIELLKGEE